MKINDAYVAEKLPNTKEDVLALMRKDENGDYRVYKERFIVSIDVCKALRELIGSTITHSLYSGTGYLEHVLDIPHVKAFDANDSSKPKTYGNITKCDMELYFRNEFPSCDLFIAKTCDLSQLNYITAHMLAGQRLLAFTAHPFGINNTTIVESTRKLNDAQFRFPNDYNRWIMFRK